MSVSRSILIVEDEPLIAMMLEDFILSIGHQVSGSCDSVKSALIEIELALSGMVMPGCTW